MKADALKKELRKAALTFADKYGLLVDKSHESALLFLNIKDNFHPESFKNICNHPEWQQRLNKPHQNVKSVFEMQSCNSSDAFLMNIFCHPDIGRWKGVRNLIREELNSITFGYPGQVYINGGQNDSTEIDMALSGLFCEAKLTETDFTQKATNMVEKYDGFHKLFHVNDLPRIGDAYDNYQIIRNLLVAVQHGKNHILLCDERRPDLVRRYFQTVSCLKDMAYRKLGRVVFWQELSSACGANLSNWIIEKYGMC